MYNFAEKMIEFLLPLVATGLRLKRCLRQWWRNKCHEGQWIIMQCAPNTGPQRHWLPINPLRGRRFRRCKFLQHHAWILDGSGNPTNHAVPFRTLYREFRVIAQQRGWLTNYQENRPVPRSPVRVNHIQWLVKRVASNLVDFEIYLALWAEDMWEHQVIHRCGNGLAIPNTNMMTCMEIEHCLPGSKYQNTCHHVVHRCMRLCPTQQEYDHVRLAYERVQPGANLF